MISTGKRQCGTSMFSSLSFNIYVEPNSHETVDSVSKHSFRLIPTECHPYLLLSSNFPHFKAIHDLAEVLPVPLKSINDSVQQYQSPHWPQKCQQQVTSSTSCWWPLFHKLSGPVFSPALQSIHPVHISLNLQSSHHSITASICSPFLCCFRRTGKWSSQVKPAAVGSAHIQTSEASEAIRYLACCKDPWHPGKSGAGFRWLGVFFTSGILSCDSRCASDKH